MVISSRYIGAKCRHLGTQEAWYAVRFLIPWALQYDAVACAPLHGFSGVRQVHFNTVLVLVRLQTHPLKHARFPEVSINWKTSGGGGTSVCVYNLVKFSQGWIAFVSTARKKTSP